MAGLWRRAEFKAVRPLWEAPAGGPFDGIRLVKITDPDDLTLWAKIIGHSGGRYAYWACGQPHDIWQFYTFLDKMGQPHCTIHSKDAEWVGRTHPDDFLRYRDDGPPVPSDTYDSLGPYSPLTFEIDGREVVIMAEGHRDADGFIFNPEERPLMQAWVDSLPVVGEVDPAIVRRFKARYSRYTG